MNLLVWIRKNPGPALFAGNAGLLVLWLAMQDPFGPFAYVVCFAQSYCARASRFHKSN
jgi:hypothetical protein